MYHPNAVLLLFPNPDAAVAIPASPQIVPLFLIRRTISMKKSSVVTSKANQTFLMAMLEMGIAKHHAELSLEETGNVGVEVATEWLFSLPPHVLQQHMTERGNGQPSAGPDSQSASTSQSHAHEVHMALEPRRVPLKASNQYDMGIHHIC